MTEYFKIGKLVSAFGLKGEMILQHNLGKKSALKGVQAIFIEEKKGAFIPWFIQGARAKSSTEIYVELQDVTTREAAVKLVQKEAWLSEKDFHAAAAKAAPIGLLGFSIMESEKSLGEILEVIEQPHQVLCRIDLDGKEAWIPLHEASLQKIDKKKKQVQVILPEGLLDIYR